MSYPYNPSQPRTRALALSLKRNVKISLGIHTLCFFLVLFKTVVFPSAPLRYIPTLKIDLVALPDVLKKDLKLPASSELAQLLKESQKSHEDAHKSLPEKAPPTPVKKNEMALKHTPPPPQPSAAKNNLRALARMRALSKMQNAVERENEDHDSRPIKGNRLSPGTSISGEAIEAAQASYLDTLRDRLEPHFAVPPWIRQLDLSAQLLLFIDAHGQIQKMSLVKSSGNSQFDDAVKRAVQESLPLPIPPKELFSSLLSSGIRVGFPL